MIPAIAGSTFESLSNFMDGTDHFFMLDMPICKDRSVDIAPLAKPETLSGMQASACEQCAEGDSCFR